MKINLILAFIFLVLPCHSQSLILTPTGFVDQQDHSKDYLVLEAPEQSQADLYKRTMGYLHTLYKNPDAALSSLENESITVSGYAPNQIRRNNMHVFDMDYNLVFRFKDGKVRIDAPSIKLTTFVSHRQTLHLVWTKASLTGADLGIYGRNDKLKAEKAKEDLEQYFNGYITRYKESLNTTNEDW